MSDIAGIVTGIQGLSVSDNQPQDGYVLTWDSENNYWIGKFNGLNVIYCSDNTTWTAPDGVSSILCIGSGGGGGGGGGCGGGLLGLSGGGGGGGAIQVTKCIFVQPNTSYDIVIGSGGSPGIHSNIGLATNGGDGYTTSFGNLFYALGAGGGERGKADGNDALGGNNFSSGLPNGNGTIIATGGKGEFAWSGSNGMPNYLGYQGGNPGTPDGTSGTGGGGGAGSQGNGGNGGYDAARPIGNGQSGNNNSGAGGGGGCGGTSVANTDGGSGGSGYLYIIY